MTTLICVVADKKHGHGEQEEASDEDVEYEDEDDHAAAFYDKSKSFFDNISCDATTKAHGYLSVALADCRRCCTAVVGIKIEFFGTFFANLN